MCGIHRSRWIGLDLVPPKHRRRIPGQTHHQHHYRLWRRTTLRQLGVRERVAGGSAAPLRSLQRLSHERDPITIDVSNLKSELVRRSNSTPVSLPKTGCLSLAPARLFLESQAAKFHNDAWSLGPRTPVPGLTSALLHVARRAAFASSPVHVKVVLLFARRTKLAGYVSPQVHKYSPS